MSLELKARGGGDSSSSHWGGVGGLVGGEGREIRWSIWGGCGSCWDLYRWDQVLLIHGGEAGGSGCHWVGGVLPHQHLKGDMEEGGGGGGRRGLTGLSCGHEFLGGLHADVDGENFCYHVTSDGVCIPIRLGVDDCKVVGILKVVRSILEGL